MPEGEKGAAEAARVQGSSGVVPAQRRAGLGSSVQTWPKRRERMRRVREMENGGEGGGARVPCRLKGKAPRTLSQGVGGWVGRHGVQRKHTRVYGERDTHEATGRRRPCARLPLFCLSPRFSCCVSCRAPCLHQKPKAFLARGAWLFLKLLCLLLHG